MANVKKRNQGSKFTEYKSFSTFHIHTSNRVKHEIWSWPLVNKHALTIHLLQ